MELTRIAPVFAVLFGFLNTCLADQAYRIEMVERPTIEGCKYVERRAVLTDPQANSKAEAFYAEGDRRRTAAWSGKCEGGYISGMGRFTTFKDGTPENGESWKQVIAGEPERFALNFVPSSGLVQYIDYREKYAMVRKLMTPAECLAIAECKALHDARAAQVGTKQMADEDAIAARGAMEQRQKDRDIQEAVAASAAEERRQAAEAASRAGAKSGTLSALGGAVAQIAGAAGGRNATQLQALGAAMQGAGSGTASVADSGMVGTGGLQAIGTASSVSEFAGTDLGKNVKFGKSAGNCVKVIRVGKQSTYDTEAPGLQNTCGSDISIAYCYEGGSFAGVGTGSTCAQRNVGQMTLTPNEKKKIGEVDSVKALYVQACEKPFVSVVPSWSGNVPKGACITSSKYGWNVGFMGGNMRD